MPPWWRTAINGAWANPKADLRLSPILHAYLEDLAKLGAYGRGNARVMRRFVEDGIRKALAAKVITPKRVDDFGGDAEEE
jgi:hypothetical protein